jgi:hypothetical protein
MAKKWPPGDGESPEGIKEICISILPPPSRWESQLLAHRIGQLRAPRALGVAGLQAAAGRIIDAHPDCSRRASRLVDRITVAMDLARLEGRP